MNTLIKNKGNLFVLTLVNEKHKDLFKKLSIDWEKYFNIEIVFDEPKNIDKYLNKQVDILFLDSSSYELFNLDYYRIWKDMQDNFLYVVVADKRSDNDVNIYKALADQIFYLDNYEEHIKWNSVAIMRRFWTTYSKPTTVIYKEIIADFIIREVLYQQVKINLSVKEFEVLKMLLENRGHYISKNEIYKKIWDQSEKDETRVLDQIILLLKKKISNKYFHTNRTKGIKFE